MKVDGMLEKARSDAQALHQRILTTATKDQTVLRTDLRNAATAAHDLALSLKGSDKTEQADAKKHLLKAAAELEIAARDTKDIANANLADLKVANKAMLIRARVVTKHLSEALAAKRSAARKVPA